MITLGSFIVISLLNLNLELNLVQAVPDTLSEAFCEATHRIAWACLTGWIVYVCHYLRSGGLLNWFLSHPIWQPIAKISLSIYLVHDIYIILTVANMKERWYFEPAWFMHIVLGDIAASTILGGVLYLVIEAPTGLIVQHFLK